MRGGTRHFYRHNQRGLQAQSLRLRVEVHASRITKLFHPLDTQSLNAHHPIVPEAVHPLIDGTLCFASQAHTLLGMRVIPWQR